MASKFSLPSKVAVGSGVLILLSLPLCGASSLGGTLGNIAVTAGLSSLGLGVLGLFVSFILMIVKVASNRVSDTPNPYQQPLPPPAAPLSPPPPPNPPDHQA